MAFGIAEDPARSPTAHLEEVEYPVWRDTLVRVAAEQDAPPDVINLFKSLPRGRYQSKEEVMRDFAEAARRFALGNRSSDEGAHRDRSDIGHGSTEHP
jgi:hypothetical protein